jgi:hypothetical protein
LDHDVPRATDGLDPLPAVLGRREVVEEDLGRLGGVRGSKPYMWSGQTAKRPSFSGPSAMRPPSCGHIVVIAYTRPFTRQSRNCAPPARGSPTSTRRACPSLSFPVPLTTNPRPRKTSKIQPHMGGDASILNPCAVSS